MLTKCRATYRQPLFDPAFFSVSVNLSLVSFHLENRDGYGTFVSLRELVKGRGEGGGGLVCVRVRACVRACHCRPVSTNGLLTP